MPAKVDLGNADKIGTEPLCDGLDRPALLGRGAKRRDVRRDWHGGLDQRLKPFAQPAVAAAFRDHVGNHPGRVPEGKVTLCKAVGAARRRRAAIAVDKSVGVGALYPTVPEGAREDVIDLVEPREVRADLEAGGPIHFGYAAVRSVADCLVTARLVTGGLSSGGLWRFAIRLHGPESLAPVQAPVTT